MPSISGLLHERFSLLPPSALQEAATAPSEEEEAAFLEQCAARLDHHARVIAILCLSFAIAWWPFDPLIYGKTLDALWPPALWRLCVCAITGFFLILPRSGFVKRQIFWFATCLLMATMFSLGYASGLMGGLDRPWFHLGYMVLYAPLLLPLPFGKRVIMNVLQALASLASIVVFHPESLTSRYFALTVSYTVCILLASLSFGQYLFLLNRDNFMKARALSRHRAELADKVDAQTREIRHLLSHLERAREEERKHISRELHDELGQELAALRYALAFTRERFRKQPSAVENNLIELESLLSRTTNTVHDLVEELRPVVLDDLGLKAATEWLTQQAQERAGLSCELSFEGDDEGLQGELASAVFRILQESLTNIVRHAQASQVEIKVRIDPSAIAIKVRDNGVGFDASVRAKGMGLLGMRERALALGARLQIDSRPQRGTEISCAFPLSAPSLASVAAPDTQEHAHART